MPSDLTRRTLLGVLKYPVAYGDVVNPDLRPRLQDATSTIRILDRNRSKPPKCYLDGEREAVDWILAPLRPSQRDTFTAIRDRSKSDKPRHGEAQHKSLDCSIMDLARAGVVIYVPRGDPEDDTRRPSRFYAVARALEAAGCAPLDFSLPTG